MTDAEFRETKKRCLEVLRWWEEPLELQAWDLKVVFHREPFEQNTFAGYRTQATCTHAWKYREATIDIDCSAAGEMDDDELERVLLHEVGHMVCGPMRSFTDVEPDEGAIAGEEYVCSTLARMLQMARRKAVKLGAKLGARVERKALKASQA